MNRRNVIKRIIIGGIAGTAAFTGYKWYDWHKSPDIGYLEKQKDLLNDMAESIIPDTGDSPGAKECNVGDYIITMVRDCTELISQNKFIDGLKDFEKYTHNHYSKPYKDCSEEEKQSILSHFERSGRPWKGIAGKVEKKYLGNSFFSTLKEYTIRGYCTSREGAMRGLAFLPVPGAYHGHVPLQPGQHSWALN